MSYTREEAIQAMCSIRSMAYHSIGRFRYPSDGFCDKCRELRWGSDTYQDAGHMIGYVRKAVVNQLKRDGFKIAEAWDSETGVEVGQ